MLRVAALGLQPEGIDLVDDHPDILVTTTAECLPELAPGGHLLVAGDAALVELCWQRSGLPRQRVYGWGSTGKALAVRNALARELQVDPRDVHVCVVGGVVLTRFTCVAGVPVLELVGPELLEEILLEKAVCPLRELVEAVAADQKRIFPLATLLRGEYGMDGLVLDVPCKLGAHGIEGVLALRLTEAEKTALRR